jgi:hypothetical protein
MADTCGRCVVTVDRQRGIQLAHKALQAEIFGQHDQAASAVQAINDELGAPGVTLAIMAWCDTLVLYYRKATGTPDDAPVQPAWLNSRTRRVAADADEVPPEVRWAGRLVAARAALDEPAWDALLAALPDDEAAIGQHVVALLSMAALTLRALNEAMP